MSLIRSSENSAVSSHDAKAFAVSSEASMLSRNSGEGIWNTTGDASLSSSARLFGVYCFQRARIKSPYECSMSLTCCRFSWVSLRRFDSWDCADPLSSSPIQRTPFYCWASTLGKCPSHMRQSVWALLGGGWISGRFKAYWSSIALTESDGSTVDGLSPLGREGKGERGSCEGEEGALFVLFGDFRITVHRIATNAPTRVVRAFTNAALTSLHFTLVPHGQCVHQCDFQSTLLHFSKGLPLGTPSPHSLNDVKHQHINTSSVFVSCSLLLPSNFDSTFPLRSTPLQPGAHYNACESTEVLPLTPDNFTLYLTTEKPDTCNANLSGAETPV